MNTKMRSLILSGVILSGLGAMTMPALEAAVTITDATFSSDMTYGGEGSDRWVCTWMDTDEIFTTFSDGRGFKPFVDRLSMGIAKVTGPATAWKGINLRSSTIERDGYGEKGEKASGMIMVDGKIYMLIGNVNHAGEQTRLAWSGDHGKTWKWPSWIIKELGYACFVNYGKNNAGALDNYVYVMSPDTPSARFETDTVVLARVPKGSIADRTKYEFFTGTTSAPKWSSAIGDRKPVFTLKGGCNRLDVTYNAPLKSFIMTMRSRGYAGGLDQFSMYYAPKPWGPWKKFYYKTTDSSQSRSVWPGESVHLPSKWISADGKTMYIIGAYLDRFNVQKFTLNVSGTPSGDVVPAAPSGLAVSAVSSTQIDLSWSDNSDNETGFKIERKKWSTGTYAEIAVVGAGETRYHDTGLVAEKRYFYRVRAVNSAGDSAFSNEANVKTPSETTPLPPPPSASFDAPSNVNAVASGGTVTVTWTDNSTDESSFRVRRREGSSGSWIYLGLVKQNVTIFTDTQVASGKTYSYKVCAAMGTGADTIYSDWSDAVEVSVP